MWKKSDLILMNITAFCCVLFLLCFQFHVNADNGGVNYEGASSSYGTVGRLVEKEERRPILSTEFGSVSAVDVGDGTGRHNHHLQFITLEPNALFLPVLLHADMVFYVHTGSGRLSWRDSNDDKMRKVHLQRGDVYRLESGALFYLHSSLENERHRLRIIAIFANPEDGAELEEPSIGPYSSINDLIRGFDNRVLQAAFQVPEEVIEEITSATDTPAIVHAETKRKKKFWEANVMFINALLGIRSYNMEAAENKKKHTKTFNFFKEDPDYKNCNGWSTAVTKHNLHALHGSNIGVFMVNLTKGSMMGPHWNPEATEVSVVLQGEGMVRVVCSSTLLTKECKNTWFRVEEGDVFTVPRFHPMAQTSFNNGSLVFMGFSTASKKNHPQFLAGKASVLQTLDKVVLGASYNVSNTTIDQLLAAQDKSIILECTSCAEEEEMLMEQEIERERQEEEERKREEEARQQEEEERRRKEEEQRRREEEERRRHEEEEERKREEEEARQKEEERRKEEEQRRREEEERRRHEEEEERKREEEAARQTEEEERRKEEEQRRREEEEQRRHEEEEARKRKEEQRRHEAEEEWRQERRKEEEQRRREEEEQRRHEEEEARKREEEQRRREAEEERRRHEEEEEEEEEKRLEEEEEQEARRREEEEAQRRHEEEKERRRREAEEEQQQEEEEERRREEEEEERRCEEEEEERMREEEERQQQKEEERRREQEEEQRRREKQRRQEEAARQREEEEWRHQEEEQRREEEEEWRRREERGRGGREGETEEEAARREEEERVERQRQEEEAARGRREMKLNRKEHRLQEKQVKVDMDREREFHKISSDKKGSSSGSNRERKRLLRRMFN